MIWGIVTALEPFIVSFFYRTQNKIFNAVLGHKSHMKHFYSDIVSFLEVENPCIPSMYFHYVEKSSIDISQTSQNILFCVSWKKLSHICKEVKFVFVLKD